MMDDDEQRAVLAEIIRDPDAYPRDRIAAIRALREMGLEAETADDLYPPDELTRRRTSRRQ